MCHDTILDFYGTSLLQHLRTHSKIVIMNLCFMLTAAQLTFLIAIDKTSPTVNCRVTALLIEYFLLVAFAVCMLL